MAGYENDWQADRAGSWSESWGSRRARGWRGQPWASRRPRNWSGTRWDEYGVEYRGRRSPYGTGYRSGSRGDLGLGYDFGYQGGEWGRPANVRDSGTRGSYGRPEREIGRTRGWSGRGRGGEHNVAYGRDYAYESSRRGAPWGYRAGRDTGYDVDFDTDFDEGRPGRPRRRTGRADLAGHPDREYEHGPVDRWPAREAARPRVRLDDEDVRESVRENLFQDSFLDPDRIDVQVERGVVTLRGEVDDFLQARSAWDDAWESAGVRGVLNHLTVRTDRATDEMQMPRLRHGPGERAD